MSMEEEYLRASGVGMQRAKDALQNIINQSRSNTDFRNKPANEASVIQDMPDKFKNRFKTKGGGTKTFDQMTEGDKVIFNFYNDGRSEFQRTLNRGRQADPFFDQAYTQRFPITSALENFAGSGGIFGTVGRAIFDKGRQTVADTVTGLKKFAQDKNIYPSTQLNTETGTTAFTSQSGPDLSGFRDSGGGIMDNNLVRPTPSMTQTDFLARPDMSPGLQTEVMNRPEILSRLQTEVMTRPEIQTDAQALAQLQNMNLVRPDMGIKSLFSGTQQQPFKPPMIPGGIPRGSLPVRQGRLLGEDPNIAYGQEMNLLDILADNLATRGFNQGGIASLNNPEYNLLMNASDFDL
tara:strand:+ start:546 stop:1592 length:1047 start_codon:yes stop_codon:yes gene_type:complete